MKAYVGIDLGTTNSAICSYDGEKVRIWKSPEQNDVTPSAIYVDRRGNRYYGMKAYNQAPYNPDNSATLFKRFMGTNTKIHLEASGIDFTPEECSAEILKVLYGYLPEEIRKDPETATVITVPAAFNQMKKDATLQAAKLAGIGRVTLMQEPVAAIMSIMRASGDNGLFLVYDLGGGTFDVSVAESLGGKVNLLAHGGIEMCGGRDIDRKLFHQIVVPWLRENFSLPDDFVTNKKYRTLCRLAQWAVEQAKIELSSSDSATIALSENETRAMDEDGNEIYLDIDITRTQVDELTEELIENTLKATRETLQKAGINSNDLERIVFVGGPTNYKPLRDKVSYELAVKSDIDVNPMTAVAEGASIFAESIDWSTENHQRKATNETLHTSLEVTFKYVARTPNDTASIVCITDQLKDEYSIQIFCTDTGWSSGQSRLEPGHVMSVPLALNGENHFRVRVYDQFGGTLNLGIEDIVITKTLATIGAIPASKSIGIEVKSRIGGTSMLEYIVQDGEPLPKKGSVTVKAGQTVKAGSNDSINIKLWEGEIQDPIEDNRFIGMIKILGTDIPTGMIPMGADIECEYEMSDSGNLNMEVSVPSIGATFNNRNFYSRQEGQIDLDDIEAVAEQGRKIADRIDAILQKVDDAELAETRQKIGYTADMDSMANVDAETVQQASNELLEAKKQISIVKQKNMKAIRQMDLDEAKKLYVAVKEIANQAEIQNLDNLMITAQRAIDRGDRDFENIMANIYRNYSTILQRQDWFMVDVYRDFTKSPAEYIDKEQFEKLKEAGDKALAADDIQQLRSVVMQLRTIRKASVSDQDMFEIANIIR